MCATRSIVFHSNVVFPVGDWICAKEFWTKSTLRLGGLCPVKVSWPPLWLNRSWNNPYVSTHLANLSNTVNQRTVNLKSLLRQNDHKGASLVAQWLRICLPMQGTRFRALVWENPTCRGATGPWATVTEPARLQPVLRNKRGRDSERPAHRDEEWSLLAATGESPRAETKTQHSQK